MGNKVEEIYYVPTQEFCALDKNSKKQFFLKTVRPEVHDELNSCIQEAMNIHEYNGKYPETFLNNTTRGIFDENDLSLYIPVTIIKNKKKYCICKDAFALKKFIVPKEILYISQDTMEKSLYNMYMYSNYWYSHRNEMECMMDLFYNELNYPKKDKIKSRKKDTK